MRYLTADTFRVLEETDRLERRMREIAAIDVPTPELQRELNDVHAQFLSAVALLPDTLSDGTIFKPNRGVFVRKAIESWAKGRAR